MTHADEGQTPAPRRAIDRLPRVLRRAWIWRAAAILAALLLTVLLAFRLSPWPGALVIRFVFERAAASLKREMQRHAPQGVSSITDQRYRAGDRDALLDVYVPDSAAQPGTRLPTVIWTHGGAWVSGHRDDAAPYFARIAAQGYTVISLGYSVAPGQTYPTPIHQVNDALAYVQENADRLHVDVNRVVMGGDSAGAQITSQLAMLIANPAYAAELGLRPSLKREQLRGVILYSGIFELAILMERAQLTPSRLLRWGTRTVVWAYTGTRNGDAAVIRQISAINHVTSDFPPAFFSSGNDDPLTDSHSRPLAAKLQELGVEVQTLFYPKDHRPALGHLYQFKLDSADAQNTLTQVLAFLKQHLGP